MNIVEQQHYDILPSIAAENAANRVKIKQEYDLLCVINNDISKADQYIESLKRDNLRYYELLEIKAQELVKLDEELSNLSLSREQIQCNSDYLKKQYELTLIDDEQRKKEQDTVCATYEKMIANRREIFNSNRLVVRRNNLENHVEAARIQSAVLEGTLKDLERQRRQFHEIQNLNLKSVSIELAETWLRNRKEKEKIIMLHNELKEKEELFNQLAALKLKPPIIINPISPSSQVVNLPIPTPSPPLQIPMLKNTDETELTKYFQKINLFKKDRSQFSLPSVLSRALPQKMKESILNSPKPSPLTIYNPPAKSNEAVSSINDNTEQKDKKDDSPQTIDSPDEDIKSIDSHPSNMPEDDIIIDTKPTHSDPVLSNEKPTQTHPQVNTHSPKTDFPGKMKLMRSSEKRASPLTVSRMSPLSSSRKSPTPSSRIPVPVCSSSPKHVSSRIPVRFTPVKVNQNKAFVHKELAARKPDSAKRNDAPKNLDIIIDTGDTCKQKREVNSPVRSVKYPKMDYAYMQATPNTQKNYPQDENIEPHFMQVDRLDNRFKKNFPKADINIEDLYNEAINENNPIARSYIERMKTLREGYKKDTWKDRHEVDDTKKHSKEAQKLNIEERESYGANDIRHLSRDKCNEFAKHYEKFQIHENLRKNDQHNEPKDFRDTEKAKSESSVKESIFRIDKKNEFARKPLDGNNFSEIDPRNEYDDNYHSNIDFYSDLDEKSSKHSAVSNDNRNRSEAFSPLSNGYFISPPGSNNFSTPLFAPMGEKGSMFSFGSSVNQLFGASTDGANNQTKNQNNGFFGFNFSSSMDQSMDQPLKLF